MLAVKEICVKPSYRHIPPERVRLSPDGTRYEVFNPLLLAWIDSAIYPQVSREGRYASGASKRASKASAQVPVAEMEAEG